MFSFSSKGQNIVFEDNEHIVYHELQGDKVIITVEDLTDFTVDLSNDADPSKVDNIMFMFDIDQTGVIDAGSGTDVYYANKITSPNNVCKGDILSDNAIGACGGLSTSADMTISLERTVTSNTPHVVYEIIIPKSELYSGSQVCSRASVRIDNINGSTLKTSKIPSSLDNYFVNNYFPVTLFEDVDLGDEMQFCSGDSVVANTNYPNYLWSNNSTANFIQPKDSGEVHLTVKDNTCSLSDTVNVVLQDENYCTSTNLRFPNIVTPNNDGLNDFFEPLASAAQNNMNYEGAELNIYNRWGVKVGGKVGQAPFWDCYFDWGQKAPSGTYFYVFSPGSTGSETINGFFTIVYTEK